MAWSTWSTEKKIGVVAAGLLLSGGAIWLVWWLVHRSRDSNGGGDQKNVNTGTFFQGAAAARHTPKDVMALLRQDDQSSSQKASLPAASDASGEADSSSSTPASHGAFPSTYLPSGYQLMGNLETGQEEMDEDLRAMMQNQTLAGQAAARGQFPAPQGPGFYAKLLAGGGGPNYVNALTGFDPAAAAAQHGVVQAPWENPLGYTILDKMVARSGPPSAPGRNALGNMP